jgi:hypothetical protein
MGPEERGLAGRFSGKALEDVGAICREAPGDETAHALYALALQSAHRRAGSPAEASCGCGSGRRYRACCQPHDRRALRRFADRRPLYRLRNELLSYFDHPDFEPTRRIARERWFGDGRQGAQGDVSDLEYEGVEVCFAYEWAFSVLPVHWDDDPDDCLLRCFSENPGVSAGDARRAREWQEHGRFGLWECSSVRQEPGTWLTDLLTGIRRYVSVAPEQLERLVPPAALQGQILPLDGVWHTAGSMAVLSLETAAGMRKAIIGLQSEILGEVSGAELRRGKAGRSRSAPDQIAQELDRLTSALVGMSLPKVTPRNWLPALAAPTAGR